MGGKQQALVGRVVSDKMEKTVVVAVETRKPHPLYRRIIRTVKKFKAHNDRNEARTGDLVRIIETRPLSKEKHWRVAEILTRGQTVEVPPEAIAAPAVEES